MNHNKRAPSTHTHLLLRHLHAGVREHKLSRAGIEGEAVDAATINGQHQLRCAAVHGVSGSHQFETGTQNLLDRRSGIGRHASGSVIDGEDGTNGNVDVNVGRPVERIHGHHVISAPRHDDGLRVLLAHDEAHHPGSGEGRNERIVGQNVQLFDL